MGKNCCSASENFDIEATKNRENKLQKNIRSTTDSSYLNFQSSDTRSTKVKLNSLFDSKISLAE